MSRGDDSKSPSKRRSPQVAGMARALPRQRVPNVTVKQYEEPPMPPEQLERLEKLAEAVKDMEWGRSEDERERRQQETMRKRDALSMRRRIQRELRKSSREVRDRESEAADIRREVKTLERDEEALISRKLRRDEKFEDAFNKVKSKEIEKNLQRLAKRTETESAHIKLSQLKASLRTLEEDQIRAITDAERGARTRSSSRATQLEFEVEKLRRESCRLDEENKLLRRELESFKSSSVLREATPERNQALEASRRVVMTSPGRMASRQKEPLDSSFGQNLSSSMTAVGSFTATAPLVPAQAVKASASAPSLPVSSLPGSAVVPLSTPVITTVPTERVSRTTGLVAPSRLGTGKAMNTDSVLPPAPAFAWGTSMPTASSRQSLDTSQTSFSAMLPTSTVVSNPMRMSSSSVRLASPSSAFRSTSATPVASHIGFGGTSSVTAPPRRVTAATPTHPNWPSPTPPLSLAAPSSPPIVAKDSTIPVVRAVPGGVAPVPSPTELRAAPPTELRAAPPRVVSPPTRAPATTAIPRASIPSPIRATALTPFWQQPIPIRA